MSGSNKDLDASADKLLAIAEQQGIAVTSVTDGHVMVFTKSHLLGILGKMEANDQDKCVVFIKHADTPAN